MHEPSSSPVAEPPRVAAALLAIAAALALPRPAAAQELVMPVVDDSPSSQLLLEQAADQARANPREAVRLLVQAIDAGPGLVVRSPRDPDLFVTVGSRVHGLLAADPALRAAYRKEVGPDADAQLARGELEELVRRRLDTEAGLRAAMMLAERAMARGSFSQALACLERTADHDLLAPPRSDRHRALLAEVRARVRGDAVSGLGAGTFDRSLAAGRWGETWSMPFAASSLVRGDGAALAVPAVAGDRVVFEDGGLLRAVDRLSGRGLWETGLAGDASPGLRTVALGPEHAVVLNWNPGSGARPATGGIACIDPASGAIRWDQRVDRLAADRSLEGAVPVGAPVVAEGRALVSLRKATARFETVSMLASVDLERPRESSWVRVVATSGSLRLGMARGGEAPVIAGGVAYLATATGAVAAVDAWDGTLRWLRRFPVPVRDRVASESAWAVSTPAVVGGRVWSVSPDRSRIMALDAADGSVVAEVATGAEAGIGGPEYVLGDDASGLVVAVGDRLFGVVASEPRTIAWSVAVDGDAGPRGRVSMARTADPSAPVIVVPGERGIRVLEMRDGSEVLALERLGGSNGVLSGAQLVVAGGLAGSSWMPIAEAERTARARMAASDATEDAMALLSLSRQVRSAELARDGATEAVRRARALAADDPRLAELLRQLLAVDSLDLPGSEAVERSVDEAARLAGMPERAGIARAERELRRGRPRDAARIAAETAFASPPGREVPFRDGFRSIDAAARAVAVRAVAADPSASRGLSDAAEAAVAAAAGASRAAVLRRAARIASGTPAGDRALADVAAAIGEDSPRELAQLADECAALGAKVPEGVLRSMSSWRAALVPRDPPPSVEGDFFRAVEFRGRLPRRSADAGHVRGGLLTLLDGALAFRAAPTYSVAWQAPIPSPDAVVVSVDPNIVVCDDGPKGTGALACIAGDGSILWSVAAPATEEADAQDDPLAATEVGSPCVAMPTLPCIVVMARDGTLRAYDRATGGLRWSRPSGGGPPAGVARSALAVVVVEAVELDGLPQHRATALDPADGTTVGTWVLGSADEFNWVRIAPGGLLVTATSSGIEARRIAGGDEDSPYWRIDGIDDLESGAGWTAPGLVAFVDRSRTLAVTDAWTGASRPRPEPDDEASVSSFAAGNGWFAALSRDAALFVDGSGVLRGRSAPGSDRTFVAAAPAADRLFVVDHAIGKDEAAEIRSSVMLRDLDPRAGGLERTPPLMLRSLLRRITDIAVTDGAVAVGNGSTIQLLEFSAGSGAISR